MGEGANAATAMTRRAPSHVYARAYRALFEARHMLQDPERYRAAIPEEEHLRRSLWDVSRVAYEVAMKVSAALRALPEFGARAISRTFSTSGGIFTCPA